MLIVSVTRLRLRKRRFIPGFAYFALASLVQARRSRGNLHATAIRQHGLVFWTITVWDDEAAMREFRTAGSHRRAMPRLAEWCDEATYVRWNRAAGEMPTLQEAFVQLKAHGIVSKVAHPSSAHEARDFPAPEEPA
jgi:hypothetical protein